MTNKIIVKDTVLYSVGYWVPYVITTLCLIGILTDLQFAFILVAGITAMLIVVGYAIGKRNFQFTFYGFSIVVAAILALITAWSILDGYLSVYALGLGYMMFLGVLAGISAVVE